MLDWLRRFFGKRSAVRAAPRMVRFGPAGGPPSSRRAGTTADSLLRARFDSAQTTSDNRRHWAAADGLSADAAASPDVRRVLRNRARYEVANNSYARGIVLTLANDVVGTGPRLQMLTGDADANRRIEAAFADWSAAVDLPAKLRTMRMARAQDGEAFAVLFANDAVPGPVTLDLRLIEADQVTTPGFRGPRLAGQPDVDGIVLDALGNPAAYHVLRTHPGSAAASPHAEFDTLPAADVLHWFRADRPGLHRGLPDILPALPLFAQLRRYTLAVIAAAESAANVAIFMKTTAPPGGEAAEVEPAATMELEPNMAVFGPEGWEPSQIRAEQPATGYGEFKREILNEIARCLNLPYNIAACNSSGYNYASGRLDHQTYFKSIRVEQSHLETAVLDRILAAWLAEARRAMGIELPELAGAAALGPVRRPPRPRRRVESRVVARRRPDAAAGYGAYGGPPSSAEAAEGTGAAHQWFWDGHEHVDPAKEAIAQQKRLASGTTTLAEEYAKCGKDWQTELRQRAREVALARELGLSDAETAPTESR